MSYQGDIRLGSTIEFTFTTRRFTTGVPFTLAGTPSIEAYQVGSSTPITAGITLTADYSSVTGLNHVSIVASGANGYATAKDVSVVIAAGTVDSVSVVGETIASFSIENRSAVMPTTAGRTLDVSAGGEAGIDWANVGSPTTSLALTGTTIATTQKVDVETIKTNAVVNGGTVTFPTNATLASTTGAVGSVTGAVGSVTGAVGSVTGAVGSVAGNVDGNVTGTVAGVTPSTAAQVAAVITTQITESYRANGAAPTLAQFMSEVLAHLGEASISSTTKTINKFDHSTAAETFTLDSATDPASITRAS